MYVEIYSTTDRDKTFKIIRAKFINYNILSV